MQVSRYALLAEVCEGGAQRDARDFNETRIGSVHLHNQEDRAGNRDCGGKEADDHSRISGSKQAEAVASVRTTFLIIGVCRRYLDFFGGGIKNRLLGIVRTIG